MTLGLGSLSSTPDPGRLQATKLDAQKARGRVVVTVRALMISA